ncbi:hypothetical protein LCGC14_0934740 [marine sediment metagenome]|uniref:Uncharacterized protein n=1 Tax=marine sediment metagenome TaxID=412755 RepID=A0A0F9P7Z4_9ZZZZ
MSNLFKARVQGSKDYVAGVSEAGITSVYDTDELREWQIGWNIEYQLHSLSSAKKELEGKLEGARNIFERLKIEIDEELEKHKFSKDLIKVIACSLGSIILCPPFFKKNLIKKIQAVYDNIRVFDSFEKEESGLLESPESEEIPNVPIESRIGSQYIDDLPNPDAEVVGEDPEIGC